MATGRWIVVVDKSLFPAASSVLVAICLLSFSQLTSAAAMPSISKQNMTIQVPPGSRYLPTEHLICTPSTWKSIAIFFLANYFSHAGTVKALPGQTAMTAFTSAFLALLLPTSGVVTGIEAMFQHAVFSKLPLERASKSGALCVVIRTPSWKPENGDVVRGIRRGGHVALRPPRFGQKKGKPVVYVRKKKNAEDPATEREEQTEGIQTERGQTEGGQTAGGQTAGGQTEGVQTEGVQTAGGQTEGGQTEGVQTEGVQTEGIQTEGIQTEGIQTEGIQTEGIQTEGIQTLKKDKHCPTVGVEILPVARLEAFLPTWSEWSLVNRKVHGLCCLPPGYALVMLPKGFKVNPVLEPDDDHIRSINAKKRYGWESWRREHLSPFDRYHYLPFYSRKADAHADASSSDEICASYNLYKSLIALFQTIYASLTLFQTRGDQINRYGFAAFGLTVVPYLIMSLVNLLGNILTPDYPSVYMVSSDVMAEAERRKEGHFEGIVGQMTEPRSQDTIDIAFKIDEDGKMYSNVLASDQDSSSAPSWQSVVPYQVETLGAKTPSFIVPGTPPEGDLSQRRSWRYKIFACSLLVASLVIALVGGLSGFRKASSTLPQRVWTAIWSCLGIFSGIAFYGWVVSEDLEDDATRANIMILLPMLVYTVPAIGGFVVVGQMIKAYGTCSQIY